MIDLDEMEKRAKRMETLGIDVFALIAEMRELRRAAEAVVELYIANPGSEGEFICCITPPHPVDVVVGHSEIWDEWDALRRALGQEVPPRPWKRKRKRRVKKEAHRG